MLFVILFGLSMDYHVFILSRIKEAVDRGESTEDAISHGIKSTAGVVTAAAIVMVGVFGIFATLQFIDMKQFGVGLATAVLIDATLVRGVLLPATMKLLGNGTGTCRAGSSGSPRAPRSRARRSRTSPERGRRRAPSRPRPPPRGPGLGSSIGARPAAGSSYSGPGAGRSVAAAGARCRRTRPWRAGGRRAAPGRRTS